MFTVVIPLYNKESYISRAVQSVLDQDYPNFELIIVNDGSTDNSMDVVSKIKDNRIRIIEQKNGGVSSARNTGIINASNNFIAFLDADDYWMNDFLSCIKILIDKYPSAGLFATSIIISGKKKKVLKYSRNFKTVLINDYCKKSNIFITSSVCVHKDAIQKIGGFPLNIKRGEDLDTWLRIACRFDIAYYNRPKVIYFLETMNNSNQGIFSYLNSFPYWEWYKYQYKNKKSLYKYTTKMLIALSYRAFIEKKYDEMKICLNKIEGKQYFLKDLIKKYYIILLSNEKILKVRRALKLVS